MRTVNFQRLNVRLLQGGVAPKYERRTVQELSCHLEDLVSQEKSNGASQTEALAVALQRLGDEDKLIREALSKKEILSWSRRYPKSVYLILPVLCYFLVVLALVLVGVVVTRTFNVDIYSGWPAWHFQMSRAAMLFIEYLITPILAASVALVAIRRNINMLWPVVGILIVCFFGSGIETIVSIPDERGRGGVNLIWGWPFLPWEYARPPWPQSLEQFARTAVTMAAVVLLFKHYRPYKGELN